MVYRNIIMSDTENIDEGNASESNVFWMSLKGLWTVFGICFVAFMIFYFGTIYITTAVRSDDGSKPIDKEVSIDNEESSTNSLSPNEAGDTAGLANGIFSALAFAGVVFAIFLQRKELELQRTELMLTRGEFVTQNETLQQQRFENTFFNMLQLQQQITDNLTASFVDDLKISGVSLDLESKDIVEIRGREVFYKSFETAKHRSTSGKWYKGMRNLMWAQGFREYEESYTPSYFDHYFRHLYRIFKFVAESPLIRDDQRYGYASLVRAQLSRYELIWLYYNGLSCYGRDKFKPLIETFAILKNIREDLLISGLKLPCEYAPSAFSHSS